GLCRRNVWRLDGTDADSRWARHDLGAGHRCRDLLYHATVVLDLFAGLAAGRDGIIDRADCCVFPKRHPRLVERARKAEHGRERRMTTQLTVSEVTKTFGGVVANERVSLAVPQGAIVGLIGPNGSGKTTLFNSIVGSHPIVIVSITFEG